MAEVQGIYSTELYLKDNQLLNGYDQVVLLPDFVYKAMAGHDYAELVIGITEDSYWESPAPGYPKERYSDRDCNGLAFLYFEGGKPEPGHKFSKEEANTLYYDYFKDEIDDIDVLEDTAEVDENGIASYERKRDDRTDDERYWDAKSDRREDDDWD